MRKIYLALENNSTGCSPVAHENLIAFVQALRGSGIPASTAEALDGLRAAALVGYEDPVLLRKALAMTLVKSTEHIDTFNQCFDLFFARRVYQSDPPDVHTEQLPPIPDGTASLLPGNSSTENSSGAGAEGAEATDLATLLRDGNDVEIAKRMANAIQSTELSRIKTITQKGLFSRRIMQAMGSDQLDTELLQLEINQQDSMAAQELRTLRNRLREDVIDEVNRQYLLFGRQERDHLRERAMQEASLRDLPEFRDVEAVIRRLARRLLHVHHRRQKTSSRGLLDMRATMRAAIAFQGMPQQLHWKTRRRNKTDLYVICDVSNSVATAARFLLMFLHAVNSAFPRVRTFVFASRSGEVTDLFLQPDARQAVETILDCYAGSGTDYAGMLSEFSATCGGRLSSTSTVIILGDARNNGLPAGQDLLRDLHKKCRQLFWLNPERRSRWGTGDSVMPVYEPYCTQSLSCTNLAQLTRFVDTLLSRSR